MDNEVIAITGGSGFLAQHLLARLAQTDHHHITEIRTIDRLPFKKFLDYSTKVPLKHLVLDICDITRLENALRGVTTVFHCAAKQFIYVHDAHNHNAEYWRDNLDATETLIDAIVACKIPRLIYVSDAYANLPVGDNYGLSEQVHTGFPSTYMLDIYGESKTRAEKCVKTTAEKGSLNAIILRPVFIYGEGEQHLISSAIKICDKYGGLPYIDDENRGHHQYLYAGNMAAIMIRSMECLRDDPSKYNGECIYCMDSTKCTRFMDFIKPFMETRNINQIAEYSYFRSYFITLYYQLLNKIAPKQAVDYLTMTAFKFLNGWTVGFSNRKLRLLLDYTPEFKQIDAIKRSIDWQRSNSSSVES